MFKAVVGSGNIPSGGGFYGFIKNIGIDNSS